MTCWILDQPYYMLDFRSAKFYEIWAPGPRPKRPIASMGPWARAHGLRARAGARAPRNPSEYCARRKKHFSGGAHFLKWVFGDFWRNP